MVGVVYARLIDRNADTDRDIQTKGQRRNFDGHPLDPLAQDFSQLFSTFRRSLRQQQKEYE